MANREDVASDSESQSEAEANSDFAGLKQLDRGKADVVLDRDNVSHPDPQSQSSSAHASMVVEMTGYWTKARYRRENQECKMGEARSRSKSASVDLHCLQSRHQPCLEMTFRYPRTELLTCGGREAWGAKGARQKIQ